MPKFDNFEMPCSDVDWYNEDDFPIEKSNENPVLPPWEEGI